MEGKDLLVNVTLYEKSKDEFMPGKQILDYQITHRLQANAKV
ncbi:hypothetical protein [Shiella aurantiaca]|nr:hypothetical protein [Shiella aurantiaca]